MIDLHLSAFAPRWRFLYVVRIDAYLEVVGRQIIETCFLRPKERPYQTVNAYDALVCQYQMEQEVKAIVEKSRQRGSKKHGGQAQAHPRRKKTD